MLKYRDTEARPLATPLYHYTSLEVFQKILESKKLWASHVAYMNDGSEFDYGVQMMTEVIGDELKVAAGREREILIALSAAIATQPAQSAPVFTLCFSEI